MKRIALLVCVLGIFSLTCFGQDTNVPAGKGGTPPPASSSKKITKPAVKPSEVKGKVEEVTLADPTKGVRAEIIITGEDARRYTLLVRSTTTIYGQDWKAISLDKLVKGQQVRVQYITNKDGMYVALSIKPFGKQKPLIENSAS
ncbi:MAG TPA: hypothetical protein VMU10_06005 [Desulfomonilia bacterium]|nr:hypothetical protein [Desulfomonilia bacterium]